MTQNPDNCTITDEEYEAFIDSWESSPCSEYGMCENCPWSTTYEKINGGIKWKM